MPLPIKKFNLIIKPNILQFDKDLNVFDLPTRTDSSIYHFLYFHALRAKKTFITNKMNPYSVPIDKIENKFIDVYYLAEKARYISRSKLLDRFMGNDTVGVYEIRINVKKSIYLSDGIYDKEYIQHLIKILNSHPCKLTRLGNGKVQIEHLTRHPINNIDFVHISNGTLTGTKGEQYQSSVGYIFDENVIDKIADLNTVDVSLYDSITQFNRATCVLSEESLFHYHNNGVRNSVYNEDIKKEIKINYDLALELLDDIIKDLN